MAAQRTAPAGRPHARASDRRLNAQASDRRLNAQASDRRLNAQASDRRLNAPRGRNMTAYRRNIRPRFELEATGVIV